MRLELPAGRFRLGCHHQQIERRVVAGKERQRTVDRGQTVGQQQTDMPDLEDRLPTDLDRPLHPEAAGDFPLPAGAVVGEPEGVDRRCRLRQLEVDPGNEQLDQVLDLDHARGQLAAEIEVGGAGRDRDDRGRLVVLLADPELSGDAARKRGGLGGR